MNCVYHYTKYDSFKGMLNGSSKNKEMNFWASSAYTMDDHYEMIYGYPFVLTVLNDCCDKMSMSKETRLDSIMPDLRKAFSLPQEHLFLPKDRIPHAISFTHAFNSDYMWENYGDKGRGICLIFNADKLDSLTDKRNDFIYDIAYLTENNLDEEIWNPLIELVRYHALLANKLIPMFKNKSDIDRYKKFILDSITPVLGALIKKENYIKEEEVRWISIDCQDNEKQRERNGQIIKYVDVKIPLDCLEGIQVGSNFKDYDDLNNLCKTVGINLKECQIRFQ